MPVLEVITGPLSGTQIPLPPRKREIVIGRDPTCEIVVSRASVSRRHARMVCHDDGIYLEDLRSINGTFINAKKADSLTRLNDGDRISVHDVSMIYRESDETVAPTQAPARKSDSADSYFGQVVIEQSQAERKAHRRVGEQKLPIQFVPYPRLLDAFSDILQEFHAELDVSATLVALLEQVFETIPSVQNGRVLIIGEDRRLTPRALKHGREEDSVVLSMQPVEDELASHVIRSGEIAVMFREDTEWAVDDQGLLVVTVPIGAGLSPGSQRAIGVLHLELQSEQRLLYTKELQFLSEAAFVAGQSILTAQRYEEKLKDAQTKWQTDAAGKVQQRLLPQKVPEVSGYSIRDYYAPAGEVGGDFFHYVPVAGGRVVIVLGDVCGKGVAAALTMAELITETRHALARSRTVRQAMLELNRMAFERDMGFVTFLMCILDPHHHRLSVANCGHLPPMHRRQECGTVVDLQPPQGGVPFGLLDEQECHPETYDLEPGDSVLIFTDGVHEATDGAGHQYGFDRTRKVFTASSGEPQSVIDAVVADVSRFRGTAEQNDDMCLVCLQRQ